MIVENFKHDSSLAFFTAERDHRKHTTAHNIHTLLHCHKEIELLVVLEGTARLFANENIYDVQAGDLVVIPPYTMHRYTIWADRDFKNYCMCFDPDLLYDKDLNDRFLSGAVSVKTVIGNSCCFDYAKRAYEAKARGTGGWEYTVVGNLSLLFGALKNNNFIFANKKSKNDFVKCVVDYMVLHYHEPITSGDISALLHFNISYFCRLFKKNFGDTFQTYLLRYRLERSKILLKSTASPITEIAFQVGFNSPAYYSLMFRKHNGISPTEYRRQGHDPS